MHGGGHGGGGGHFTGHAGVDGGQGEDRYRPAPHRDVREAREAPGYRPSLVDRLKLALQQRRRSR